VPFRANGETSDRDVLVGLLCQLLGCWINAGIQDLREEAVVVLNEKQRKPFGRTEGRTGRGGRSGEETTKVFPRGQRPGGSKQVCGRPGTSERGAPQLWRGEGLGDGSWKKAGKKVVSVGVGRGQIEKFQAGQRGERGESFEMGELRARC